MRRDCVVRDRFALQGGTGDFPCYAVAGKGLILPRGGNHKDSALLSSHDAGLLRIKGAKYRFALQDGTWDFS